MKDYVKLLHTIERNGRKSDRTVDLVIFETKEELEAIMPSLREQSVRGDRVVRYNDGELNTICRF
jgi:hypothetical protein